MQGKLWNVGVRVADVAGEVAYFTGIGGRLRVHERLETDDGAFEYAIVEFGGTRMFLTPKTLFEDKLPYPLRDGLTHAVFEVDDMDAAMAELAEAGTEVLLPPVEVSAGFGSRRLSFLRSPGGVVFEVMQIRESLI